MLMNLNRICAFCFIIIIWSADYSLLAQQQQDTTVFELDPVVVTGTRIQRERSKIPSSISIVPREVLERSGQFNILPVLVSQVPGFFLNDRGIIGYGVGPNSGGTVSIRGISGPRNTRVLVLIDGQPQFMGIFGHPIADAYTSSDVERVEVLRGAASLLYGSNALGGAINIITRKPQQEGWHGTTRLAYGSFNTGRFSSTLSYKKGKLEAFTSVNREQTDGFREEGKDDFENTTAFFKLAYQASESFSLSGDAQIADAVYYQPGTIGAPLDNDRREYLRGRAAVSLENTFEKVEGALKLFYNFGEHEFMDGFASHDVNRGLTFYQNLKLISDNIITLGIDYKNFGGKAINDSLPPPARAGLGQQHLIDEVDLYTMVQHTFMEKLSLQGGVRLIHNSQYGFTSTPGAGLAYQPAKNTTVKASAAKAFRSPAVVDLFLFPPANQDLQPEELWSYEFGVNQYFINKKLRLEVTGFVNYGSNLIQVMPVAVPGPPQGRNTGNFSNRGIELQTRYQPGKQLNFIFNYSLLKASETVLYAPKHALNFQVNYSYRKLGLQMDLRRVAGLNTSLQTDISREDYTLLDVRLNYKSADWLQIFIEGNNLLNTAYQIEHGYPMPGINMLSGVSFYF